MTARRAASSFLQNGPSPPRLPAEQQAEFERLQRAAEAALSSHNNINNTTTTATTVAAPATATPQQQQPSQQQDASPSKTPAAGSLSGGMRQGAPPEFAGDKNPRTGEVGGPKNEPLRWGSGGDWSFNGRVTDF